MKCPKCGSEDIIFGRTTSVTRLKEHRCKNCNNEWYVAISSYQQRLDKVLEKFEKYNKGLYYKLTRYLEINYNKNKFYLIVLDEGTWVDYNEIELDLVEQLIKRFGGTK